MNGTNPFIDESDSSFDPCLASGGKGDPKLALGAGVATKIFADINVVLSMFNAVFMIVLLYKILEIDWRYTDKYKSPICICLKLGD